MIFIGKKFKKKLKILILLFIFTYLSVIIISSVERNIMPTLIEMSIVKAKMSADSAIDEAVSDCIDSLNLNASDFFEESDDTRFVTADTVLINRLCADINSRLDDILFAYGEKEISIPIGAATGVDLFATTGPEIKFKVVHMEDTSVDYETSFSEAGINQTNFKVWLTVNINMRLVNPLKSATITSTRKIMLMDTVIGGKVPENYLRLSRPDVLEENVDEEVSRRDYGY